MITIKDSGCEFKFPVDTEMKKVMYTLSPIAFEKACVSADVKMLINCIDQKYGKGTGLRLISMVLSTIYTNEDLDEADKEIKGNE